ncbi:MAG TPA: two-component system response regulator BtsR [Desulfomonilaceae bacterium]|nr:two-component system response regulator BtsR [Desulfomonilaceae bacterium]
MIRTLIIDDEVHAREELQALLEETGEFMIAGSCANAVEALQAIKHERPDLIFLDIQMPGITGLELLSMIDQELMPIVVFVTAYDEYALRAFDENALDYLLKPVEKQRLAKTLQKIGKMLGQKVRPTYTAPPVEKIPCISANRIKLINVSDVEYVRSDVGGVYVVCSQGEFFTELTLRVLESRTALIRCHKQFLANIDLMDEIIPQENQSALIQMKSKRTVPVSRRFFKKIKTHLGI